MSDLKSGFPSTYADVEFRTLLAAFEQGPARLAAVLVDLSLEDVKARVIPDKWSIQEIVMHLADAEIMGAGRIRQTFAEPGSRYAIYDQDVRGSTFDYNSQDSAAVQHALLVFESLRRSSAAIFRRARPSDWLKTGWHAEHGQVTLRNLLELYADHSERHIEQILQRRSLLGKPGAHRKESGMLHESKKPAPSESKPAFDQPDAARKSIAFGKRICLLCGKETESPSQTTRLTHVRLFL